jgi:high affinity sulfate transporter 1
MTAPTTTTVPAASGLARYIPAVAWVRAYDRRWLRADVVGGLAAGAVVVPQAMAYASIAQLPAHIGLYTCMVPMVAYAVLGGSRTLSVSTTSTVASLTGTSLLATSAAASSDDPARTLATLTVLVGLVLLAARALRLGSLIDNISGATTTGIKIGVGLTVAAGQIPALLGVEGDPTAQSFFAKVGGIVGDLGDVSATTAALSAGTIVGLLLLKRVAPQVPGPLVAVAVGIALVAVGDLDAHGVALIDPVPSGLPAPILPVADEVSALLPGALAIAIMCFMETAAVAGVVRRPSEPSIDNDQELLANGVSCVAGGLFRAMPSAGGFSQTAINQSAGARTQASELVTALLAVACALVLGGVLSDLPEATLGCLVLIAVLGLVKPSELVRYWRHSRIELWVALLTAAAGLCFNLLVAVLVGVILTLYLVLYELDHIGVTELQPTPAGDDVRVADATTQPEPGLLLLRVDGPLYTANIKRVNRRILAATDAAIAAGRELDTVVVDATSVGLLPFTVLDQAEDLERELAERGVLLWAASIPPQALETAGTMPRWEELEAEGRVQPTALAAVRAHRSRPEEL